MSLVPSTQAIVDAMRRLGVKVIEVPRLDIAAPRLGKLEGIMAHFDASVRDDGAISWLRQSPLGYDFAITDNGDAYLFNPDLFGRRMPHAGKTMASRPEFHYLAHHGNTAFIGIAITAGGKKTDVIRPPQFDTFCKAATLVFLAKGWTTAESWRLTTHTLEAWPRGRKHDIEGPPEWGHLVADPVQLRASIVDRLPLYRGQVS